MLTDTQVISEWDRRCKTTWRAIRLAVGTCLASGATFWYLARTPAADMSGAELIAVFSLFLVLAVSMLVIIFRTRKLYRCPRCNSVPQGTWSEFGPTSFGLHSGISINPKRCPTCGATLQDAN
jgi:hypothetical protein